MYITLTVSESKRLIAKGVANLAYIQQALRKGTIVVAGGTTNGFILEELTGKTIKKERYTAGRIYRGELGVTPSEERLPPLVLKDGQPTDLSWLEALQEFSKGDVFIKGGNAIDMAGNVGVLMANREGGTIGGALGTIIARGAHLVLPVGLEKLIFSVPDASSFMGVDALDGGMGLKVGLMSISYGQLITEIEALKLLSDVEAVVPVAAGGVGGSEGSQTLLLLGSNEKVELAFSIAQGVKGEPALSD